MCGRQLCAQRKAPSRITESTRRHSSSFISPNGVSARIAALLTSMSSRPNALAAAAAIAATAPASVMSAICSAARPPAASISATVCCASSREPCAFTMTAAPPAASASEIARPMLRAPPVTSATFPASSLASPMVLSYKNFTHEKQDYRPAQGLSGLDPGQGLPAAALQVAERQGERRGVGGARRLRLRLPSRAPFRHGRPRSTTTSRRAFRAPRNSCSTPSA